MQVTRFELLGPVQAVAEGGALPLGAPKQRALLARLLLERGRVVPRGSLVDALWGERPPESAPASLQVYAHGLRRALGAERIVTVGGGYRVQLEPGELDVERFEQLLERADRALDQGAPSPALEDAQAALALWQGAPLADLRDQPFAEAAAALLDDLRLRALELRAAALLALGEHDALLSDLEQLIAEHPYRERLREQQILALYRAGRQKDALDAYRAARTTLLDELGVDPGPALQELERAILRHDQTLQAPVAPPPAATRLPAPATPLVGRRLEIAAVEALLRTEARLVTLTGPGGTGKTRLAMAVAASLERAVRDGAVFVDLSAVTAAPGVLPAVAQALGVTGSTDDVIEHVRDRSLLLVLDNLEQLGDETRPVAELLAAAPRLRVLATSRVPLRLSGEHDYPVPPLPVPGHGGFEELVANDAVRLFAARARAADPTFALTAETLDGVVAVCRRLDGLPLALELAAAWVKVLSPAEIGRRLGGALDLLVSGPRDLPERQRTLRATLDWSHDLLREPEQRLLAELSVFAGGWRLEDAEAVAPEPSVEALASLVDHSLVRRRGERFTMLETIREYAAEQLGPRTEELRRRHAAWFVEVADRARTAMLEGGDTEIEALRLLQTEIENLRAALDALHEAGEVELEAGLAVALRWYWIVRGPTEEGSRIFERIAAKSEPLPRVHAEALSGAGVFNYRRGDRVRAAGQLELARQAFAGLDDENEEGRCISELGAIAVDEGELPRAAELFAQAVGLFERCGNRDRLGVAISNLAAVATLRGLYEEAAAHGSRAIAMQRDANDKGGLGVSLANYGRARLKAGGDEQEARAALREAFTLALEIDYRMLIAYLVGDAARFAGGPEDTVRLVGAAAGLFEATGLAIPPEEAVEHEQTLAPLRGTLDVEALLRQGREAPVDSMIESARALI